MNSLARTNSNRGLASRGLFPDFFTDIDRFFDQDLFRMPTQMMANMPAVNIRENENDFSIEVAAPGMKKEDFHIDVEDRMLTIGSQKEENKTDQKENYTRREYNYSAFSRSFRLPESVKEEEINARYEDGLLKITVPKPKETERQRKRIEIK